MYRFFMTAVTLAALLVWGMEGAVADGGDGGAGGDGSPTAAGTGGAGGAGDPAGGRGGDGSADLDEPGDDGQGPNGGAGGINPSPAASGGGPGSGGGGGYAGAGGGGGGGGGGGTGVTLSGGGEISNVSGGNGGNGGDGVNGSGGGGGGGGNGAVLGNGSYNVSAGNTIAGGFGGNGGSTFSGSIFQGGGGGSGGHGVVMQDGGTLANAGNIHGGGGGIAGVGGTGVPSGLGGVGVIGQNMTIINSGTISGGFAANGPRAAAIEIGTGTNRLELRFGSVINGNVLATTGSDDTFALGGNANSSFDVSKIDDAAQYRGFESYEKTGNSVWTLTGTTATQTPWTINQGTLSVSSDGNLGASSGDLTINGGTLQNTAAFTTTRNIELGMGGGTFETQADLTASGVISGVGTLMKTGDDTLTLSGINTHTGGALIRSGTLSISSDANLGDPIGGLILNGGTLQNTAVLTTSRDIVLNSGGGTFRTDADLTVNSVISGIGSLTKIGSRNLILSTASTYTGGTTVSQGTIIAAVTGALGSGPVLVESNAGRLVFVDQASAGDLTITNQQSFIDFRGTSSAGTATIDNNQGSINFYDTASAENAIIINNGGGASFNGASTAGNANITNVNGGPLNFKDTASAGNAIITNNAGGSTVFNDNSTAGSATIINNAGGLVNISHLASDGIAIGSLSGDGNVTLGSKALTLGGLGRNEAIDGVIQDGVDFTGGSLVKTGDGTLTLSGINTYTGTTTVDAGILNINGSIANSPVVINDGGILGGTGTVGPTTLAAGGIVAPGSSIGTLLVDGDYIGNRGTLNIEAQVGGDGFPADRLLISGDATGTTLVEVQNQGGTGAATGTGNTGGASLIQVGGNSAANAFQLAGEYVAIGPYRYELQAYDPGTSADSQLDPRLADAGATDFWDYRLQAAAPPGGEPIPPGDGPTPPGGGPRPPAPPVLVPQIPVYQALAPGALQYGWALFDNLHQRLGEIKHVTDVRQSPDEGEGYESFFRVRGRNGEFNGDHGADFEQDLWFLQAGADLVGYGMRETGDSLRLGLAFSYGRSDIALERPDVTNGGLEFDSPALALTGTYQAASGWYLDTVFQGNYYDAAVATAARGKVADFNGAGFGTSVEAGYPILIAPLLILEPQAQLAYQANWFDDFTDIDGVAVDVDDVEGLRGRLGGRLQKTFVAGGEASRRLWSPYLSANLAQGFLGAGNLTAGGVGFDTDASSTALLFGTGLNAQLGERWGLYSNATYIEGLADGGIAYAWAGMGGVRLNF